MRGVHSRPRPPLCGDGVVSRFLLQCSQCVARNNLVSFYVFLVTFTVTQIAHVCMGTKLAFHFSFLVRFYTKLGHLLHIVWIVFSIELIHCIRYNAFQTNTPLKMHTERLDDMTTPGGCS